MRPRSAETAASGDAAADHEHVDGDGLAHDSLTIPPFSNFTYLTCLFLNPARLAEAAVALCHARAGTNRKATVTSAAVRPPTTRVVCAPSTADTGR